MVGLRQFYKSHITMEMSIDVNPGGVIGGATE
jgi:hypothetical protein